MNRWVGMTLPYSSTVLHFNKSLIYYESLFTGSYNFSQYHHLLIIFIFHLFFGDIIKLYRELLQSSSIIVYFNMRYVTNLITGSSNSSQNCHTFMYLIFYLCSSKRLLRYIIGSSCIGVTSYIATGAKYIIRKSYCWRLQLTKKNCHTFIYLIFASVLQRDC